MSSIIESLNNYAGLFSLLAVLAAIVVPIVIHKRERQDNSRFPMSFEEREYYTKKSKLEKGLKRK